MAVSRDEPQVSEVEALRLRVAQLEAENQALKARRAPIDLYASLESMQKRLYASLDASSQLLTPIIPAVKKRQYFAVALLFLAYPFALLSTAYALYRLYVTRSATGAALAAAYAAWVYMDEAPRKCGRSQEWLRFSRYATWLGGYFPIDLRKANKDAAFDPRERYMFGYHPHGIISVGCFTQFAFDGSGARDLFPGLRFHCATLNFNFRVPIFRELLIALGIIEVSAQSIRNALASGPGAAVVIVPGGAAESLDASPGKDTILTLRKRNGFFRIALQHGVKLVPLFSFGENEMYETVSPSGFVRRTQQALLKLAGFTVPVYLGAGSNSSVFGSPIPRRHPIITVVGDPISCPIIEHPTQDQIDDLKQKYIANLKTIFETFAADCGAREHTLTIDK